LILSKAQRKILLQQVTRINLLVKLQIMQLNLKSF